MGTLHGQIVNSDFLARHPPQPGQKSIFGMRPAGDGAEEEEEEAAAAAVAEEEAEGVQPRDELASLLGTLCSQIVSSDFLQRNPARGESIFTHADPMLAAEGTTTCTSTSPLSPLRVRMTCDVGIPDI